MNVDLSRQASAHPAKPKRVYGGLSADTRAQMRRERLIEAAIELFGTTGYATTSIDSICSGASVSTRDFYSHFSTKEDLLLGAYDHIVGGCLASVVKAMADVQRDPVESARAALEAFVDAMVRDESWARINFIEVVGVSERVELHRRVAINRFARELQDFVAGRIAAGAVDWIEVSELRSIALVGAVHETLTDWILRKDRAPLELVLSELVDLFLAAARR